jgi:hypothetical protein
MDGHSKAPYPHYCASSEHFSGRAGLPGLEASRFNAKNSVAFGAYDFFLFGF